MPSPNPYQPPAATPRHSRAGWRQRKGLAVSVFMIVAGLAFCFGSFFALLANGLDPLLEAYPSVGRFPIWFLIFYGFVSGLTSAFHLLYLLRGWPQQAIAGIYAIGCALGLTAITAAVLEVVAR